MKRNNVGRRHDAVCSNSKSEAEKRRTVINVDDRQAKFVLCMKELVAQSQKENISRKV